MENPKCFNFQGIHTIRLYLPPVLTTINNFIPPISPYLPSGKTHFLLNITYYSYVTSICMNICTYFLKCIRLPYFLISSLVEYHIIDVHLLIHFTYISYGNTNTILAHQYNKWHTLKTIYILFWMGIICIINIGNCFE